MMLGVLIALVLASAFTEAHIKLYYLPWQLPIRNAPSANSDGTFSAAANQPCGGSNDWGRLNQNRYARVVDGQYLCTRANWNGGHSTTPNENKLKATFRCNRPSQPTDLLGLNPLILANGTNPAPEPNMYLVDAPITNQVFNGYTLCLYLPFQGITSAANDGDPARQCTLAITEGNSWGGCHDLLLMPNGTTYAPLTPAPLPSPAEYALSIEQPLNLSNSEGTYQINNCYTDTGGKCCLTGFFGVRTNGAVSARFYGNGDYPTCYQLSWGYSDYQAILRPTVFSETLYQANLYLYMGYNQYGRPMTTQNMSLTMRDGGSMSLSNVGFDIPIVADHDVTYYSTLDNGLTLNYIPWPNYSDSADNTPYGLIAGVIVAGVITLYLVGGVLYSKMNGGPCEHPHIHALLIQCGCVRKRRKNKQIIQDDVDVEKPVLQAASKPVSKPKAGYSLQLPPNWQSAVDPMSGEVYYYNTSTKETKWDRPLM